jgi:hypothetical protein
MSSTSHYQWQIVVASETTSLNQVLPPLGMNHKTCASFRKTTEVGHENIVFDMAFKQAEPLSQHPNASIVPGTMSF